jgi:hypothetical protein
MCTNDGGKEGNIAREGGKDKCVPFYIFGVRGFCW